MPSGEWKWELDYYDEFDPWGCTDGVTAEECAALAHGSCAIFRPGVSCQDQSCEALPWYVDCYQNGSDDMADCGGCGAGPFASYEEANAWAIANPPPAGCDLTVVNPPGALRTGKIETRSLPRPMVGTELKKLLGKLGFSAEHKGCKCKDRAALMDRNGLDWCVQNVDMIVGWLEEEARNRKLPFMRTAGQMVVKLAIHNAKKTFSRTKRGI